MLELAVALTETGVDIVMLADTLGYASPSQVRRIVRAVRAEIGAERFGNLHLHDTLGTALANVLAALEEGVRGFDAALGGLGGCPFAPGSVGNVSTEDSSIFWSEGYNTGIDLAKLISAARYCAPACRMSGCTGGWRRPACRELTVPRPRPAPHKRCWPCKTNVEGRKHDHVCIFPGRCGASHAARPASA